MTAPRVPARRNPVARALRSPHLRPRPYKGRSRRYDRAAAKRGKDNQ